MIAALAALLAAAAPAAAARPLPPDAPPLFSGAGTPWSIGPRHGAVGLFRPLTLGLGDTTDLTLQTTAVVGLLAPRVEAKRTLWADGPFAAAAAVEAALPTAGLRRFQEGFVQPIASDQTIPWAPIVGATGLVGWRDGPLTAAFGLRVRTAIGAGAGTLTQQDLVWLDPAIAPLTEGWSLQPQVRLDYAPNPRWLLTAAGRAELAAGPELSGRLFALRALRPHLAAGFGLSGALARESWGWTWPAVLPVNALPTFDLQGRW
jgi:hypothetical protein